MFERVSAKWCSAVGGHHVLSVARTVTVQVMTGPVSPGLTNKHFISHTHNALENSVLQFTNTTLGGTDMVHETGANEVTICRLTTVFEILNSCRDNVKRS